MRRIRRATVFVGALSLAVLATACEPPPSPWHAERVNLDDAGNAREIFPAGLAASLDGTHVAYSSSWDMVGDGQGDGTFVRDLSTGTTSRASTERTRWIRFSPDGTKLLAFTTRLLSPDVAVLDLVVLDLVTGASTIAAESVGAQTVPDDGRVPPLPEARWSPDSAKIVFTGQASVPGGPTDLQACPYPPSGPLIFWINCNDAYVYDLATAATTVVSTSADGTTTANGHTDSATFTPDGSEVLYRTDATNQVPQGTPRGSIYLRDLTTGATTVVDATPTASNTFSSIRPRLSPDGSRVLLTTRASNLGPVDTNDQADVYVRDLVTGSFSLVSVDAGGAAVGGSGLEFSPDGGSVLFTSTADNLGGNDTDGTDDLHVRDLAGATTALVTTNGDCTGSSSAPVATGSFSPDGRSVLFPSTGDDLGATDENDASDLYVHDLDTCTNNLVSARADGTRSGNAASTEGRFLDAGRVAFLSDASDLVPDDGNAHADVFVATLQGADLALTGSGTWADGEQTYDLEVVNDGPDTAEETVVAVRAPAEATLVASTPACVENPDDPGVVVCDLGHVAGGATVDVHIVMALDPSQPHFEVQALVNADTFDYDRRNNEARFLSG